MDYQYLMKQARATQRRMAYAVFGFVSKNVWDSRMRATRHFREWYLRPMNYARIMELPLTHLLLDPKIGERILDVSSPCDKRPITGAWFGGCQPKHRSRCDPKRHMT
jgi:hypothetical protein